jgi:hypothetical protein
MEARTAASKRTFDRARRRVLAGVGAALLLAGIAAAPPGRAAPAPAQQVPRPLLDLDSAASALFDAAEAERWADAHKALVAAQTAARSIDDMQTSFSEAGGRLSRFFAATNQLTADLIDARAAESVRDRPWLVDSADNLLARAGDLTEPYAARIDAPLPRLEVLLVLARRMRRAPAWQDAGGFAAARGAFDRLWPALRAELIVRAPRGVGRVDAARARITTAPSSANARSLYLELRGLLGALESGR